MTIGRSPEQPREVAELPLRQRVVRAVHRRRTQHGYREAAAGVGLAQKVLAVDLALLVAAGVRRPLQREVGLDRVAFRPLVHRGRAAEDVAADVAVQRLDRGPERLRDVGGRVEGGVEGPSPQRGGYLGGLLAVRSYRGHALGQLGRRRASVQHGDRVAFGVKELHEPESYEPRSAKYECFHGVTCG